MGVIILQPEGVVRGGRPRQGDVGGVEGVEGRIDGDSGSPGLLSDRSHHGREELRQILAETDQSGGTEVQELDLPLPAVTNTQTNIIIHLIDEQSLRPGQFLLDWVGKSEDGGPEN